MSDTETILAFAGLMLVIALAAIGLDWFGKPVKGRRFVPKMYRYPHERRLRGTATPWPEPRPAPPTAPEVVATSAKLAVRNARDASERLGKSVADQVSDVVRSASERAAVDLDEAEATEPDAPPPPRSHREFIAARSLTQRHARATSEHRAVRSPVDRAERARGWAPGDDVFNLREDGSAPDPAEVERRFWLNVSSADTGRVFGVANHRRMVEGKPPRRRNRRTGRVESMLLDGVDDSATDGRTPTPAWPSGDVDPFDL